MELLHAINPARICFLRHHSKQRALNEVIDCGAHTGLPCDREELKERISYREQIMSTGIGLGIGLPHVRMQGVSEPYIIIGLQPDGIIDYNTVDNLPVKIIFMIIVGQEQQRTYLELLAQIISLLKRSRMRDALLNAKTPEEVYQIFAKEVS